MDLQEYVSEGPVLLIWVAAGCRGCHSWTDMISDEVESGNITNSSVLSIHRYSSFESPSYVEESYGKNSSNPVSWTLALPQENTPVINLDTGQESQYSIYDSFGNPSTPTLQIMDETGKLIWSSKTYWPTSEIVDEIKNIFVEPYLPNHEIGIMHLAAGIWNGNKDMRLDKEVKIKIETLQKKSLSKSLRFGH